MINRNRIDVLYRYSPFSVDRNIDKKKIIASWTNMLTERKKYIFSYNSENVEFYFDINKWESDYFGLSSVVLYFINYGKADRNILQEAFVAFKQNLKSKLPHGYIITTEIPSEDNFILQFLNSIKFRTVETRLHYLKSDLENLNLSRFSIREATKGDIRNLKKIAMSMRNDFDRFHSDWSFDNEIADNYLSTYIENSINGYADLVIVPDDPEVPSDSFLTANFLEDHWPELNYSISKMTLSAVSSTTNKGWYKKLISEMTYLLKERGAKSIFMNTQSTNIAVLVTWEKLGYRIGRVSHILTWNTND
ncbi:hypothetical protein [Salinimicrobium sediminilitoris]|uniref:hypothetical protein n=1 Tax=Salinimicrobium sediminilitoris TaxID=2876715 RepID=UPI001E5A90D9|nr:hypothetical protein [Salinimicrobium sediminilitoris]MCC8358763.1 hypothetical protein [Salinimicrobium sediminilitoris]